MKSKPLFGASFSVKYARDLDLDWRRLFITSLDELKIRRFRLMSHWDLIEPAAGEFDFVDLDWQFDQVTERGGQVSLTVGWRQPHYPECHQPAWVNQLTESDRRAALMTFLAGVVTRYRDHPAIESLQLENEALNRHFGHCSDFDRGRLTQELALVKRLDPKLPVIMSLSNSWGLPLRKPHPDRYGISIYLRRHRGSGYTDTLLPPSFQRFRAAAIKLIQRRPVFIHELQAEPWGPGGTQGLSSAEQALSMDPTQFNRACSYARKTGLSPIDLWGLEWWYWRKVKFNDPAMWRAAQRLFTRSDL